MKSPDYWRIEKGKGARPFKRMMMAPASWVYRGGVRLKSLTTLTYKSTHPVICIGNMTVGGTGKTPVTLAIAERLTAQGFDVQVVSRGYGGSLAGPVQVDPEKHDYSKVGDEPLLLARSVPVIVAKNKAAGVRHALKRGADLVLLDDGMQNESVAKTFTFCVIDASVGLGNRRVLPAGPLRERPARALERIDAIILVHNTGEAARSIDDILPERPSDLPVLDVQIAPCEAPTGNAVYAFAGIGRPEKFFNALVDSGVHLTGTVCFPDHHPFTMGELQELREAARRYNAVLMTTEKDWLRLPTDWRRMVKTWPITARFADEKALDALLIRALSTPMDDHTEAQD
jgi:tetraacyldisaccharide 4'-kinase